MLTTVDVWRRSPRLLMAFRDLRSHADESDRRDMGWSGPRTRGRMRRSPRVPVESATRGPHENTPREGTTLPFRGALTFGDLKS